LQMNRLAAVITCHSWNADGTKVAICPNTNEIQIYSYHNNQFTLEHTFSEHDQLVTSIDWAHKSNKIVSCSQDRNAYVWTEENNEWKPTLVILRINRAATHVKWSPQENKFAVASGAKLVSLCFYEEDNNWWVSKHIKEQKSKKIKMHTSTVTHIDWHPNNCLLATASTDCKVRIFGVHIKGIDEKAPDTPWGNKLIFGEALAEIDANGWVQSVQWSPDGSQVACCAQGSSVFIASMTEAEPKIECVQYSELPLRDLLWINSNSIVGVGYDCTPMLFQNQGGWKFIKTLDNVEPVQSSTNKTSAMSMFKRIVDTGSSNEKDTKLHTRHQNSITCIQAYKRSGCDITQYSTTGLDGLLAFWDVPQL